MDSFLKALIEIGSGASVFLAMFGAWLHTLMARKDRRHIWYALSKTGYALIVGGLLVVVAGIPDGIKGSPLVFEYSLGLLVSSIGFAGTAFDAISQYVEYSNERDDDTQDL